MKRKFLVRLTTVFTALCMMFGVAACGEAENSGDSNSDEQQQEQEQEQEQHIHSFGEWKVTKEATCTARGEQQRECTVCGKKESSSFPAKGHSFYQGKCIVCGASDPNAEQQPSDGKGEEQKPNKPSENQIEVEVYIDNVLSETLYTDSSKGNKITLPKKPEDMTTDPDLKNYFDGWYADKGYNTPLTGEETYRSASAIYGRNITWKTSDFKYTVNAGEAAITRYLNSTATVVVVPRYINSFPVTTIGQGAFQDKTMLRTVFLCEGLKEIEGLAFCNCNSMQKIVIPSTVNTIRDGAYYDCNSLQEVHITDLSAWCKIEFEKGDSNPLCYAHHLYLNGKEVTKVEFPHDISKIGQYAFYKCSLLKEISIPDSVTSIGEQAFYECSGLTSVTIGSGVTSIGEYAFLRCSGLTGELKIPDSVTSIGRATFSGCSGLESIVFGEDSHLHEIEDRVFADCTGLTSITLPKSVCDIGSCVFAGCTNLDKVYMPGGRWRYVVATHKEDYPNGGFHIWSDFADVNVDLSNPEDAAWYLKGNAKAIFL